MRVSSPDMFLDSRIEQFFVKCVSAIWSIGVQQIFAVQQSAKKSCSTREVFYTWKVILQFFLPSRKKVGKLLSYQHCLCKEPVSFKKDRRGCLKINNRHVLISLSALMIFESINHLEKLILKKRTQNNYKIKLCIFVWIGKERFWLQKTMIF